MPFDTHWTFLIASGYCRYSSILWIFSKDEILTVLYHFNTGMGIWMTVTAGLTAFYMFRLFITIYSGKRTQTCSHPHESPLSMTFPLMFLGLITVVGGFIPFGKFVTADRADYTIHLDMMIATISVVVAVIAILLLYYLYRKPSNVPTQMANKVRRLYIAAYHRFYIDEVYMFITKKLSSMEFPADCLVRPPRGRWNDERYGIGYRLDIH